LIQGRFQGQDYKLVAISDQKEPEMIVDKQHPQCFMQVTNLWQDVTLLIFGQYVEAGVTKLELINKFVASDFDGNAEVSLEPLPVTGTPPAIKYKSILFSIDAFPYDIGTVNFSVYQRDQNNASVLNQATFSLSRQPSSNCRVEHSEPIQ
jgi:hypothetical protein